MYSPVVTAVSNTSHVHRDKLNFGSSPKISDWIDYFDSHPYVREVVAEGIQGAIVLAHPYSYFEEQGLFPASKQPPWFHIKPGKTGGHRDLPEEELYEFIEVGDSPLNSIDTIEHLTHPPKRVRSTHKPLLTTRPPQAPVPLAALPPVQLNPVPQTFPRMPFTKKGLKMEKKKKPVRVRKPKSKVARVGKAFSAMNIAPVSSMVTSQYGRPTVIGNPYTGDGSIRIKRREFLGDLATSTTNFGVIYSVSINPGLPQFHWLSGIATQFDQYRIEKLRFIYETDLGTATAGSVYMALDYDPSDAPPTTKNDIRDMTSAIKFPVYANTVLEADTSLMRSTLHNHFVRGGAPPTNADIKTYDVANFYVATSYVNPAVIAELSVEYDIVLVSPHLDLSDRASYDSYQATFTTAAYGTPFLGAPTNYNPLLTGLRVAFNTAGTIFLPRDAGMYICILEVRSGTGTGIPVLPVSSDPGLVTVSAFVGATTFNSASLAQSIILFRIEVFSSLGDNLVISNGVNCSGSLNGATLANTRLTVLTGNSFV